MTFVRGGKSLVLLLGPSFYPLPTQYYPSKTVSYHVSYYFMSSIFSTVTLQKSE